MKTMVCDHLPCMNRIPYDDWRAAVDKGGQIILCGHCEDSISPSPLVKEIMDMSIDDIYGLFSADPEQAE